MVEQPSYRVERINELIRRELVMLLRQETKDLRLQVVRITVDIFLSLRTKILYKYNDIRYT
jgi:ribosome-binding factor A